MATLQTDVPSGGRADAIRGAANDRFLIVMLGVMVVGAIIQITLGGVVRVTESGLGCPDWPLCHGAIIPKFEYHTMIEWSHRTSGSIVGLFFIAAVVRVWLSHRDNGFLLAMTTGSLVLIAIVGGIGGAVVLSEVEPALRTLHLGLAEGVVLLALLALAAAVTGWRPGLSGDAAGGAVESTGNLITIRRFTVLAAALALVTLLSGSYAVWRGAGAVCPSWPLCGGSFIPGSELVWIHAIHRLTAIAVTLVALYAAHKAYRLPGASLNIRLLSLGAMATVVIQVLVGAANPWTDFSEWAQAIHLSMATIMWTDLVLLVAVLAMRPYEGDGGSNPSSGSGSGSLRSVGT
ncbi:MAG TPA: COX15/CtaA family protein [Dehalococcoidia bacterium]|nr:COX15/CtaA family protein [Dehalococcoidia bacterium]MDP7160722.1 COX15/CtaA family protein [Dehalococcoidia bacterium]MDP7212290.1 COX15/CtaA family protein [Dehalococcoidia bacterium]MDP7515460.1 COX15/CtaA family protein [Dehalococcoidia bacterium]HJM53746.1 COX15/CtaA family protein [Dehalococcoidia bacterium]